MMSTNKKLATAVTVAIFSLSVTGSVFAAPGLVNLTTEDVTIYHDQATTPVDAVQDNFINAGSAEGGIKYATELFGGDSPSLPDTLSAGVVYTTGGGIDQNFYLTFSLSNNAGFDKAVLFTNTSNVDAWVAGKIEENYVKFDIQVTDTKAIVKGEAFLLKYNLKKTSSLSQAGNKIEMTVSPIVSGQATPYLVDFVDTVTVAQSTQAVTIELKPVEILNAEISTEGGSAEFSVTPAAEADSIDGVYFDNPTRARLANLTIEHDDEALDSDGVNIFQLGSNSGKLEKATITITDGQFIASMTPPGKIELVTDETTASPNGEFTGSATPDVEISEDGTTATIDVTDTIVNLIDIDNTAVNFSDYKRTSQVVLVADGVTAINVPENAPCATFDIDYSDESIKDFAMEGCVVLPKIPQDGTICTVNIVPKSAASDALSILITNKGNDEAQLFGSMYGQDGTEIFSNQPLVDSTGTDTLGAQKTMRISTNELLAMADGTVWTGRGTLRISTTLDIEVLALIRDVASNINSNTSQGANGASCN